MASNNWGISKLALLVLTVVLMSPAAGWAAYPDDWTMKFDVGANGAFPRTVRVTATPGPATGKVEFVNNTVTVVYETIAITQQAVTADTGGRTRLFTSAYGSQACIKFKQATTAPDTFYYAAFYAMVAEVRPFPKDPAPPAPPDRKDPAPPAPPDRWSFVQVFPPDPALTTLQQLDPLFISSPAGGAPKIDPSFPAFLEVPDPAKPTAPAKVWAMLDLPGIIIQSVLPVDRVGDWTKPPLSESDELKPKKLNVATLPTASTDLVFHTWVVGRGGKAANGPTTTKIAGHWRWTLTLTRNAIVPSGPAYLDDPNDPNSWKTPFTPASFTFTTSAVGTQLPEWAPLPVATTADLDVANPANKEHVELKNYREIMRTFFSDPPLVSPYESGTNANYENWTIDNWR